MPFVTNSLGLLSRSRNRVCVVNTPPHHHTVGQYQIALISFEANVDSCHMPYISTPFLRVATVIHINQPSAFVLGRRLSGIGARVGGDQICVVVGKSTFPAPLMIHTVLCERITAKIIHNGFRRNIFHQRFCLNLFILCDNPRFPL